ncbi:MAG: dockerin type I repeat-containing protein, partial [Oscillospiraceae bacterium]|nr:dockerin type I repeat-containing protein [Oscillospiraceae bacterium]
AKAGKAVLKGDVNLDGNVSIKDAVLIQKYLHNLETLSAEQKEQANLIEDNTVNIFDLCVLKNMLIG